MNGVKEILIVFSRKFFQCCCVVMSHVTSCVKKSYRPPSMYRLSELADYLRSPSGSCHGISGETLPTLPDQGRTIYGARDSPRNSLSTDPPLHVLWIFPAARAARQVSCTRLPDREIINPLYLYYHNFCSGKGIRNQKRRGLSVQFLLFPASFRKWMCGIPTTPACSITFFRSSEIENFLAFSTESHAKSINTSVGSSMFWKT